MKKVVVATAALLFVSCVSGGHSTDPNKTNPDWGWRSAGLTASSVDLGSNAGYQFIAHIGKQIFVMDARILDSKRKYRIFTSLQGSSKWDTLSMPNGRSPYTWLPDSPFVYVGVESGGQVWRYDVRYSSWTDLKTGADTQYRITGLGLLQGHLVASMASSTSKNWPILIQGSDSIWKDIRSGLGDSSEINFHTGIEYHGTFYAATYDTGVWAWTPSDSMWRKIQDPSSPFDSAVHDGKFPRTMVVFNDSLYVGYYNNNGIQKLLGNTWSRMDSCAVYPSGGTKIANCAGPVHAYTSAIWNNHLIVSGYYSSIPVVDMAPAKPKGWSLLGGDTWKGGFTTYDMTVVGDTLYTASWEAVWKYPLSQLDSAVKMYSAYPQYPSSSSAATALTKNK